MTRLPFVAARVPTRLSRASTRLLAVAVLVVLGSCSGPLPPVPDRIDRFDLVADVPVAGAQIEAVLDDGITLISAESLRDDVWVRAVSRGSSVYVTWIALGAAAGPQVRVTLGRTTPSDVAPPLVRAASYATSDGEDLGGSVLRWRASDETGAAASEPDVDAGAVSAEAALEAWFADYGLGDLSRSDTVEVQDALLLLDLLRYGGWDDFRRYHGDVDGNGVLDDADLDSLLEKIVDPQLPASLTVKPSALSFAQLSGAAGKTAVVLVANRGRLPFPNLQWSVPTGALETTVAGIDGQTVALDVELPQRIGWRPGFLHVTDGAAGEAFVRLGHLVLLVAGQSNAVGWGLPVSGWPEGESASVRMLDNGYRWMPASEPLDDDLDGAQLDPISADPLAKYSFGTRLGHLLAADTGFTSYLIPAAKGGSRVTLAADSGGWLPGSSTDDRSTLFGSAVFRALVSAGLEPNPVQSQELPAEAGPINALIWYQGESDSSDEARRSDFVSGTRDVISEFRNQLMVPVVYVQLASHRDTTRNVSQLWVAERQRRMETGSGYPEAAGFEDHHMVVALDLPRSDNIHLSAYGQRLLAERIGLAVREHVLGEDVDGTGPRLVGIDWDGGTRVTLRTTHELRAGPVDLSYVTVFDGPPNGVNTSTDPPVGTNVIPVASVDRDFDDRTSIRITLAGAPVVGQPHVVYMPPAGLPDDASAWSTVEADVIRAAQGVGVENLGLPLPAFGPNAPD